QRQRPRRRRPRAEDEVRDLLEARAGEPRQAEDLAPAELEGDAVEESALEAVDRGVDASARQVVLLGLEHVDPAADDHLDELLLRGLPRDDGADTPAVP